MGKSIDKEYLDLFIGETKEYLDILSEIISKLSKLKEADKTALKLVDEAIRLMHSIKGNAAMIGLNTISLLAHKTEDVLTAIRKQELRIGKDVAQLLYEVVDKLNSIVTTLESEELENIEKTDISDVLRKLEEVKNNLKKQPSKTLEEKKPASIEAGEKPLPSSVEEYVEAMGEESATQISSRYIQELMKLSEMEKGKVTEALSRDLQIYRVILKFKKTPMFVLRYFIALQKIGELGEIIKTIPSGPDASKAKIPYVFILAGIRKLQELEEILKEIPDLEHYEVSKIDPKELKVHIDKISSSKDPSADKLSEIENLLKKVEEKDTKSKAPEKVHSTQKLEEVRVNVKTLDALFNMVGELVLVKSRLAAIISRYDIPDIKETLTTFERLVSELQDEVMRMRLVPLQYLFRSLPRYISEKAEKYSKEIDAYFEGGEIALDRKVLEDLAEPLFSLIEILIRDDIEQANERIRKGKPSVGTIKVSATREGNHVILTVESDGKGIDHEEVKRRAVELGLVPPSTIEKISKDEALMLMTLPGFSLKNGEYRGLDMVKKAIEALGGTLEIYSKIDLETKFILKIPVSMATLRALLVKLNGIPYAIPITNVVTTAKLERKSDIGLANIIQYQDKILPVHDLSKLLNINGSREKRYAVIIERRGKLIALAVDEILGQEDIVVKPLSKLLARVKGLSGATILGDGKVCLILDPLSLISQ